MYQNLTLKRQRWRNKIKRLIGNCRSLQVSELAIWMEGTLIIRLDNENSTIKDPIMMVPITAGRHRIIVARQGAIIVAAGEQAYSPHWHTVQETVQSVPDAKGPNDEDNDGAQEDEKSAKRR